jgi:hypothetical protein
MHPCTPGVQVMAAGQAAAQKPGNTHLSAKLEVESPGPRGQGEAWAVYEPQKIGNSPIYIAPSQYEVEDARPYKFSGYTDRQSFSVPSASLVQAGSAEVPANSVDR